jgi:lipopolysaccharide/colanic/teichoic acid biosynthesis glycosyltransferase
LILKRLFDLVVSAVGLLAAGPVFLLLAAAIMRESAGPVFYRGVRVGLHGRTFRIFKFRSMVTNAENIGGSSTADDDPRITRTGKFIRKYKLDELSQLINVLLGDMSFVGPRPEVPYYVDKYTEEEKAILTVRPGITDWATIWNADEGAVLAGSPDPEAAYEQLIRPTKIRLQLKYIRERTFFVDIKILLLTFLAMIRPGSKAVEEIRNMNAQNNTASGGSL